MKPTTTMDAVGRIIRVGDTVGGTADDEQHTTVVGPVTEIGDGRVRVALTHPVSATADREKWLPAGRTFFIGRSLDGQLRALGNEIAHWGPALFHLTAIEDDTVTMSRLDQAVPDGAREIHVCRALISHALTVLVRGEHSTTTTSQGPALIYAASDQATLWRVDQTTVDDPREWALCCGLLRHALDLCDQGAPVRVDEKGRVRP